jgi:hypothetical protein
MAALALDAEAIESLPDPLARTAASGRYPDAWDRRQPERPFLPPHLLDTGGPWVCLGDEEGRFLAPFHLRMRNGRDAFTVHARLPGGRNATEAWVRTACGATAEGRPPPDPPEGTALALVRRALLVDRQGEPRVSPLAVRIQIRVIGGGGRPGPGRPATDAVFEWNLDARRLLAGERASLRPVSPGEVDLLFFGEGPGDDPFEPDAPEWVGPPAGSPVLDSCILCHSPPLGIQSLTHSLGPIGPLPGDLRPSTPTREEALFVQWKRSRPEFEVLRRAFGR